MTEMTISQALRRAAKLKGQLKELLQRAQLAVSYMEKSPPGFDFSACMEEAAGVRAELLSVSAAVAVANATNLVEMDGKKVLLVLAVKTLEELKGQIKWLKELPVRTRDESSEESTETVYVKGDYQHVTVEKKWKCALPEAKRAALVQSLQDRFDLLNDAVETMNHRAIVTVVR